MRRGAKSRRKEGQEELHDLKWKGKVGWVGLSALQTYGSEKLAEGKGSWKEKRRGFFRKGLRGTVPHRPPFQAWVRRCAARQGRSWRISRTRLASASLNPPQAALGSAPTADPHNSLMGKSGPGKSGSERKAKWPGQQGRKPGTSELFLGRRSGAEREIKSWMLKACRQAL